MADLVAQGSVGSLGGLASYEASYAEGDVGELKITMRLIPPGFVALVQKTAEVTQLPLTGPVRTEAGRVVVIPFRKSLAPLALLAIVVGAVFVGLILLLVTSWALFRSAAPAFAGIAGIAIVAVAAAFIVAGGRKRVRSVAT